MTLMECADPTELNATYKDAHREHRADHGCDPFACPDLKALAEQWRQWHVREIGRREGHRPRDPSSPRPPSVPRTPLHARLAHPNDDGTITCTGECGEIKPANKFPTVKGGIGRESVCRACRDADTAKRKNLGATQ